MNKLSFVLLTLSLLSFLGIGCSTRDHYTASPQENYRALWEILDREYCYFPQKLEPGVTWYKMYEKYLPEVQGNISNDSLFDVMAKLIAELKDGHVNLSSSFDISRYTAWHSLYPSNLNPALRNRYLYPKYRTAGSMYYTTIEYRNHIKDSIGYIYYPSFNGALSASNISAVFSRLAHCKGLIIDIRGNGGGLVSNATLLAQHFTEEPLLTGYIRHKTGPGHDEFSQPLPIVLDTLKQGIRWLRPVVVLTNRGVYSAANDFVMNVKEMPFVTIVGDNTGGGGGLPKNSELPNGWLLRFSSSVVTNAKDEHVEFGIPPHYFVELDLQDEKELKDTLIEYAIEYLNERIKKALITGVYTK